MTIIRIVLISKFAIDEIVSSKQFLDSILSTIKLEIKLKIRMFNDVEIIKNKTTHANDVKCCVKSLINHDIKKIHMTSTFVRTQSRSKVFFNLSTSEVF